MLKEKNMNIEIREIESSKELLTIDAAEYWYGGKITYRQKIVESQTFYIYRFSEDTVILFITDGLKTDPPLSPTIYEHDRERYEKVFTIPKGIIHAYHSDWIDPNDLDHYRRALNNGIFISTTRDDAVAKERYKEYLKCKVDDAENDRISASHNLYMAKKAKKKYQVNIDSL